jgi:hypothetical protein
MATSKVGFCILCEGVRPEPNNKANVLGFYGVLPDAKILVRELGKPVLAVMFLAGLRGPTAGISLLAEVLDPDDNVIAKSDEVPFPDIPDESSGLSGFAFAPIIFNKEGTYYFQLTLSGKERYKNTFLVQQATEPIIHLESR